MMGCRRAFSSSSALSPKGEALVAKVRATWNTYSSRGGPRGEGFVGVSEVRGALEAAARGGGARARGAEIALRQVLALGEGREVQERMRVKVSESFLEEILEIPPGATAPHPAWSIVAPDAREIEDMRGEVDPSSQNAYSPVPGLVHKYDDLVLLYAAINCSSHCRYCYRSDLFTGDSGKERASIERAAAYVRAYNANAESPVAEALLSGGDPLTLPNATLVRYLALLAESGIKIARLGSKELAFHPGRFDNDFFSALDAFRETYPEVRLVLVGHYVHPFELVEATTTAAGDYDYSLYARRVVRKDVARALERVHRRSGWLSHVNQFPLISGVNHDPRVLRLLLYQCYLLGIPVHNVYACREIVGNAHFRGDKDVVDQYHLLRDARRGLSGIPAARARLVMSTDIGKLEVVGATRDRVLLRLDRVPRGFDVVKRGGGDDVLVAHLARLPDNRLWWFDDTVVRSALSRRDHDVVAAIRRARSPSASLERATAAAAAAETSLSSVNNNNNTQVLSPPRNRREKLSSSSPAVVRVGDDVEVAVDTTVREQITLADVLADLDIVACTCGQHLSCSTCVGFVDASAPLQAPGDDELDAVDAVVPKNTTYDDGGGAIARASCAITLEPGVTYTFRPLLEGGGRGLLPSS